jgi:hypothetical protein
MRGSREPHALLTALCLSFLFLLFAPICIMPAFSLPADGKQEVRCLIFIEGNPGYQERIQAVFEQANKYLEREGAEILLVPSSTSHQIEFKGDTTRKMLNELRQAAKTSPSSTWDLAIAFTNGPLQGPNGENWSGVIEKRESRHIIIKCLNYNTLLHEIGHALGLSHGTGIMLSTLKTSYVPMDSEYRESLKTARTMFSDRAASNRYGAGYTAQKASSSLRLAQASGN